MAITAAAHAGAEDPAAAARRLESALSAHLAGLEAAVEASPSPKPDSVGHALGGWTPAELERHLRSLEQRVYEADPTVRRGLQSRLTTLRVALEGPLGWQIARPGATVKSAGVLQGRVTEAINGNPVGSADVILLPVGGGNTFFGATGPSGYFSFGGLPAGDYLLEVVAYHDSIASYWIRERYDDVHCAFGCPLDEGTIVPIGESSVVLGIDVELDVGGRIRGSVRVEGTSQPLSSADVELLDGSGDSVASAGCDGEGLFEFGGLPPGTYYVAAHSSFHVGELFDGVECRPTCDIADATPIVLGPAQVTSDVDFELDPLGSISGRVTREIGGEPVEFQQVAAYDLDLDFLQGATAGEDGRYTISGLPDGNVYVFAGMGSEFRHELFDDVPCFAIHSCDLSAATLVTVSENTTTTGIDFQLRRNGSITGTVTNESGAPLQNVEVLLERSPPGFGLRDQTDGFGHFHFDLLRDASYFLTTDNDLGYLDERYDDVPCSGSGGGCEPDSGLPLLVETETTRVADFSLARGGTIGGRVTAADGGDQIGTVLRLFREGNATAAITSPDLAGFYHLTGLAPGTYTLRAEAHEFRTEYWDDVPCPGDNDCDGVIGAPVVVPGPGSVVDGFDFALDRWGEIVCRLRDAVSASPVEGSCIFRDSSFDIAEICFTNEIGACIETGVLPGNYYLIVQPDEARHFAGVFGGPPCPSDWAGSCDPLTGAAIPVAVNSKLDLTIDLVPFDIFRDGFESGGLLAWSLAIP